MRAVGLRYPDARTWLGHQDRGPVKVERGPMAKLLGSTPAVPVWHERTARCSPMRDESETSLRFERRKAFHTEDTENHEGPRRFVAMTGRADVVDDGTGRRRICDLLLREPPWFSVSSVVNPCCHEPRTNCDHPRAFTRDQKHTTSDV
jgi:hypothetical protein